MSKDASTARLLGFQYAARRMTSDEFAVPFCRIHHRCCITSATRLLQKAGIDPIEAARKLWRCTRPENGPKDSKA